MSNNTFEENRLMDAFYSEACSFDEALSLAQKYNYVSLENLKDCEEVNQTYIEDFKEKIVMNRLFSLISEGVTILFAGLISIVSPLIATGVLGLSSINVLISHIKKTSKLKKCLEKAYQYQDKFDSYSYQIQMSEHYLQNKNKMLSWIYLEVIRMLKGLDLESQKQYYNSLSKILKNNKDNLDELYQELGLFRDELYESQKDAMPQYQYNDTNTIDQMLSHLEIIDTMDENIFNHIHYLIFDLSRDLRYAYILKLGEIVVSKLKNHEIALSPRTEQYALAYLADLLKDTEEFKYAYTNMDLDDLIMFAIDLMNKKPVR